MSTARLSAQVLAHQIQLGRLLRRTAYNYRVRSADAAGNTAVSAVSSFTTR